MNKCYQYGLPDTKGHKVATVGGTGTGATGCDGKMVE